MIRAHPRGLEGKLRSVFAVQYFPKDRALNRRKNFCFVTFATQQVPCPAYTLCLSQRCMYMGCMQSLPVLSLTLTPVQAAEKAAAQSNREISGYRIESISITHERQEHYVRKQSGLPTGLTSAGMPQEADLEYVEDPSGQWAAAAGARSFAPESFAPYGGGLGGLVRYPHMVCACSAACDASLSPNQCTHPAGGPVAVSTVPCARLAGCSIAAGCAWCGRRLAPDGAEGE